MVTDTTPKGPETLRVIRSILFLLAALFVVAAVYYYFVPVNVASREGVFGCGSAANPPNADKDGFQYGACQKSAVVYQYRTYAMLAAALITALGAFLIGRGPGSAWDDDIDLADRRDADRRARRGERTERDERHDLDDRSSLRGAPARSRDRDGDDDDVDTDTRASRADRRARRDDDFLGDELDDAPSRRETRRRRDDDF